ncbi:hypothetical protein DMI69_07345 [Escherichia coli]|nr:hypothetical protein [Escherichia coli]
MVFIFRLATSRIRIFECPHRLSDKLLKSSCRGFSQRRGVCIIRFPLQSQAFILLFCRNSQENPLTPACLPLFRVSGGAL